MLKSHPDLVEDFFGPPYVDLFSPGGAGRAAEAASADLATAFQDVLRAGERRVVIATLAWAPELLKSLLERLAEEDQAAFLQLRDLVGDPPDIELVLSNIATPAAWLRDAAAPVWQALALMAEQRGEWLPASIAWASAGEPSRRLRGSGLIRLGRGKRARGRRRRPPRDDARSGTRAIESRPAPGRGRGARPSPQEQLDTLATVELRDEVDVALVSAQQALACLLLPEGVDRAEALPQRRSKRCPSNLGVRSIAVNISVQRARLYVIDGRTPPASALRQDNRVALSCAMSCCVSVAGRSTGDCSCLRLMR